MHGTKCLLLALSCFLAASSLQLTGQTEGANPHYRIYRGSDGLPTTLDALLAESNKTEVTFLGEVHNDPTAHSVEVQILEASQGEHLTLSLEMFERDTQPLLDEYLSGLIAEKSFLKESRPWTNYKQDYRPLVEYAREHHLAVIAANAPERYVNRVSRLGAGSLAQLDEHAQLFLPPLPYPAASDAYAARFRKQMEGHAVPAPSAKPSAGGSTGTPSPPPMPAMDLNKALEAQALWDATMAFSLADYLTRYPGSHIVQVNGGFHSSEHLGTAEQLQHYRPGTRSLVVTMLPSTKNLSFDKSEMQNEGDYVIVTDGSLIKTEEAPPPAQSGK